MGFDTGYGGGDQQGDGSGSFFDDPSFLAQLQGAFGQGGGGGNGQQYAQYNDPPINTQYGSIGAATGGPTNLGAGGGALFSPHPTPMPAGGGQGNPVSLPDGSQATSPFEVGGNSGSTSGPPMGSEAWMRARVPHYGDLSWGESHRGKQYPSGGGQVGGWYGGYGQQGGGGQQQWYRPQGSDRPAPDNPGAAYDAGPGRAQARDEAAGMSQGGPAPSRWQMPPGGAYGRPQPRQRRRFYGNTGAIQGPQGSPGGAPQGGGY